MTCVPVNDVQLYVVERGKGQPILFVHGFPLDHSMWQRQIEDLSRRYHVIAPDLRGFGKSDVTEGTVTMSQMADDLAALLTALDVLQPVVFCGLSMGGYIAWQFYKHYADRVHSLILCDTRAVADSEEIVRHRHETADQVLIQGPGFLADTMTEKLFAPATLEHQIEMVDHTRAVMLATKPEGIAAALRGMAERPDATNMLGEIGVPTLVVCGQYDAISTVEEMRAVAAKIPAARFLEVAEAGHMAPLEQPTTVIAAMDDFLSHA